MQHQHIYNLIKYGKIFELFQLINNGYVSTDIIFGKGRSMLHVSVYYGNKNIFRQLVGYYGMIDNIVDEDGKTALHVASIHSNDLEYTRMLLNENNINKKDSKGFTPVRYSYANSNNEVTNYLISMGAECDDIPIMRQDFIKYEISTNIPNHFLNEHLEMLIETKNMPYML